MMTGTYSPDDNKLRLYASSRLDADTYARAKACGFRWAPKQELFFAYWTPQAADLLTELAGEIEDEDKSLTERAEERADRFEGYSDRRAADADRARSAVDQIAQRFEGGQPILVGHHSERRARKDKERIENGMRKAIRAFQTSQYWSDRAAGAIRHARYLERADVRARRIKTLEAALRKQERTKADAQKWLTAWTKDGLTLEQARTLSNYSRLYVVRNDEERINWTAYDVLRPDEDRYRACPAWTVEQVQDAARKAYPRTIAWCDRWIEHYENRLTYERAMLAESGYTPPPKPKTKAELPLLNYSGTVNYRNPYRTGEIVTCEAVPCTREQWSKIGNDYKGTRVSACGTHRVRTAIHVPGHGRDLCAVYITDAKQHPRPTAEAIDAKAAEERAAADERAEAKMRREIARIEAREAAAPAQAERLTKAEPFKAMAAALKQGITVVSAPQLFPTPAALAEQMVDLAAIEPGMRILEPSAGTGAIADAIVAAHPDAYLICNEINPQLVRALDAKGHRATCEDFLTYTAPPFDRVIMNPPFANAADVEHITHALALLKPGGRLVAICANGPRQRAKLLPIVEDHGGEWTDLPAGTFASSGTNVNTALLCIDVPEAEQTQPTPEPLQENRPAITGTPIQTSLFG